MDVREMIAQAKEELREEFRERLWNLVQFGPFTLSSSSGDGDKVEGFSNDGAGDKAYDYEVKRMQHFGLRTRPPKDVWAIRIGVGGGATNNVTVAEESDKYGPSDLDDGEVAIYNKATGTLIKLDKDGNIHVTPAPGKDVIISGGDLKNARVTDPLAVGTLTGQAGAVPVVFTYVPTMNVGGVDTPGAPTTGPSVSLAGIVSNAGGADHVKS